MKARHRPFASGTGWLFLALVLTVLAACNSQPETEPVSEAPAVEITPPPEGPGAGNSALHIPTLAQEEAPESFQARFETTKGSFTLEVRRAWGPVGADRIYNLVRIGYYDDNAFFRAIKNFIIQFGVNGNPEINRIWSEQWIHDDPRNRQSNIRGMVSFAMSGPDSRTTQLFINLQDNQDLDRQFVPIAKVVEGMDVVDSINTSYGELYPIGEGPRTRLLGLRGSEYLHLQFPEMDYIVQAEVITPPE